ncbi:hypothetical protein GQ43DRAFT_416809 [Delitschia confertaspora ATCC 74209]|uniref:Thioesterase/thiol ester dehydrase-isomerase n=1 Tax=Delitschia confertaspora ATCC 74209 TaxID=1513339 RepID=A0A9P4JKD8_9PLEO|nr:hypothetical protein GQ43DRAFT_416809 [Delitschia confertaspora ATCC 74209]
MRSRLLPQAHAILRSQRPLCESSIRQARHTSTESNNDKLATASLNPRWLSDLKSRVGKCITFGLTSEQVNEAGSLLQEIAHDWRDLVAGSEGFLTAKNRRGLYRQEVVWGEMSSPLRHVNNVMYNRYAESARCNWALHFANVHDSEHKEEWKGLLGPKGIGLIMRSIKTEFKFPMKWPDHVTVLHKLSTRPEPGMDHFFLDVMILSELHRRPAARCVEDIVVYDYKIGRKAPLKPFMVDQFQKLWEAQEQAKVKYGGRVVELHRKVEKLEKESWNRPDAKEDLGTA